MADAPTPEGLAAELERAFEESKVIRTAIRDAVRNAANQRSAETGKPVHPGALIAALLTEAGTVCGLWGMSLRKRPDEIEGYFESALRNARRGFRLELQQMLRGQHPISDSGGQAH